MKNRLQKIAFAAAFALSFGLSAAADGPVSPTAAPPLARIYRGNVLIGTVIRWGRELGKGGVASVREAVVDYRHVGVKTVAVRRFTLNEHRLDDIPLHLSGWDRVKRLFAADPDKRLARAQTGLRMFAGPRGSEAPADVVISEVYPHVASELLIQLDAAPNTPAFAGELERVVQFKEQMHQAVKLFGAEGLVHGDIKPQNVFAAETSPGQWKFTLGDFDTVVEDQGESSPYLSRDLCPPEVFLSKGEIAATPAADIYALATSVFSMAFGRAPIEEYRASLGRKRPGFHDAIFSSRVEYRKYTDWIDQRFRTLEARVSGEKPRRQIEELRGFVRDGMRYDPGERLIGYPLTQVRRAAKACAHAVEEVFLRKRGAGGG